VTLPPVSEPDRAALANWAAATLHIRRRDGGESVQLYLAMLDRCELEALTLRLVYCLSEWGQASDESLRGWLLALEAAG
jgi:hypothetical protein